MFNYGSRGGWFVPGRLVTGQNFKEYLNYKTIYAGVDPADPSRVLIRKIVQINENTYCYEETRITPTEKSPSVHTHLYRVKDFDLKEDLTPEETQIRGAFRPLPNVIGFSRYYRDYASWYGSHFSIVENTLYKSAGGTWLEWFQDLRDRRDMSSYLRKSWRTYTL